MLLLFYWTQIKMPRLLNMSVGRAWKKANLILLHSHRLASSTELSITKILKNSRDEVKKTCELKD